MIRAKTSRLSVTGAMLLLAPAHLFSAPIPEDCFIGGFGGNLSIEYEYNWTTSLPEVAQCIGFVRGYGTRK